MPTRCFMVDSDDTEAQKQPGAMWEVPNYGPNGEYRDFAERNIFSMEYLRDRADRNPICVRLPDGTAWLVDQAAGDSRMDRLGWAVSGDPPNITARPSIDVVGSYHGWLTNGVLSDDLEGRTYGEG